MGINKAVKAKVKIESLIRFQLVLEKIKMISRFSYRRL